MNARTSKPSAGNKFYITTSKGGYSWCIQGKPTDTCNVLANCVGYACGRFNEIIGSMKYPALNCNAENFIERAKSLGLSISNVPTLGGIMVWQKGATLDGKDGAGHVAVVERIDNINQIYTSESGYNSSAFWNTLRTNDNGRWGQNSAYTFRGCIINPAIGNVVAPQPSKSTEELAKEVIAGKWGNYPERKTRLESAGYNYSEVQRRVNELVSGNTKKYIQINATAGVWCRTGGYGFNAPKYKVIPYQTKCELISKNVGNSNGYSWDKVIYEGKTVYLPNKWNKYL